MKLSPHVHDDLSKFTSFTSTVIKNRRFFYFANNNQYLVIEAIAFDAQMPQIDSKHNRKEN
jgi:hypothetical protein